MALMINISRHPENTACYHFYAVGFFSSDVENKQLQILCTEWNRENVFWSTWFQEFEEAETKNTWGLKVWSDMDSPLNSLFTVVFFYFAMKVTLEYCGFRVHQWPSVRSFFCSGKWSLIFLIAGFSLSCSGCSIETLSHFRNLPFQDLCRRMVDLVCLWRTENLDYHALPLPSVSQQENCRNARRFSLQAESQWPLQ